MAASMGPPVAMGFSLRVQLFSPNAYGAGDMPIRCFRVVTSPDLTIREFCQEASRIHDINYGQSLAIKKCQDDQAFDVTQSEVVGHLFTSGSTIRVIQASPIASIRDSVPPDSALRYEPALSAKQRNKRNRGSSVRPNGALSPAFSSNKRQKLSDISPDHPLPSRELDLESSQGEHNATIIPNSQPSTGLLGDIRDEIRDSVSPPPELLHSMNIEKRPTNEHFDKPATASRTNTRSALTHGSPFNPTAPTSASAKSKGANNHTQRVTEPGTPVSAGAASPVSTDQQLPHSKRSTLANKSRLSGLATVNGIQSPKPRSQKSIYDVDDVESDNTSSSAILDKTKASLKVRKSPLSGLSAQDRRDKFNTPPNGNRRSSLAGDQVSSPKLPLTPSSKQREEKQQKLDNVKKARSAAAEAAEQRVRETSEQKRREAEETSKANRAKSAELARQKKEEQEKVDATAARLEKERIEKIEREKKAEEERQAERKRTEEAKKKKAKEQAETLEREKKARIEKEKQEEKVRNEKAKAEAERSLKEEERKRKAEADAIAVAAATAAEVLKKSKKKARAEPETMERKLSTASVESSRSGSHAVQTPIPRPQSSTPFIPSGRKSVLKAPQAALSFSPAPRESPSESSISSSQISQITPSTRRVSFNIEATPVRTSSGGRRFAKLQKAVPPEKQSQTPILPPSVKLSKERPTSQIPLPRTTSITPPASQILPPRITSITPPASITPKVTVKKASPAPIPSKKNETIRPSITKGKIKAVETTPAQDSKPDTSSKGAKSDRNTSEDLNTSKSLNSTIRPNTLSPKIASKPEPAPKEKVDEEQHGDEDEDGDVEMESRQSTPPETRSPVVFNHHPVALQRVPTLELSKVTDVAEDEAETQSLSDASSADDESVESSEEHDEDEDVVEDEDEKMIDAESEEDDASTVKAPQSSLDLSLPQLDSQSTVSGGKPKPRTGRFSPSLSDKESTTQDAIDNQLTSSIFEAHASSPSTTAQNRKKTDSPSIVPGSQRPKFKIGASLRDLNAAQGVSGRSSPVVGQGVVDRHRTMKLMGGDESESESESDSGDDSDDSDEEEVTSKAFDAQLSQAQSVPLPDSDDDSSDDSDSDSEKELNDSMRSRLITDIAQVMQKTSSPIRPQSSSSQPQGSKNRSRIAGRDIVQEEKRKREQKYLTGYTFSQVR